MPHPAAIGQALQASIAAGIEHYRSGRLAEAEAAFRRVLDVAPDNAECLNLLGVVVADLGNGLQAISHLDRALRIAPDNAAFHTNRGEILRRWGLLDEAVASCQRAVELDPRSPEARNNYGLALLMKARHAEAVPQFEAACELNPGMAKAHFNLGRARKVLGDWNGAAASLRRSLEIDPGYPEAWYELACLQERFEDARASIASCERALALRPAFPEVLVQLGDAWSALGEGGEAERAYRRALGHMPGYAPAQYQLSLCLLGRGDFAEGWALYESRCSPSMPGAVTQPLLPMPMWQGEDLSGSRLLVLTEQGYGDHIQFCRLVPELARRGATVVMGASPEMSALMRRQAGVHQVITQVENAWEAGCNLWTFIGSLPLRLGVQADAVPADVPYIAPDPEKSEAWRVRLERHRPALKVGLVWSGRPTHGNDWRRSIAPEQLAALAAIPNTVFFSLQLGAPRSPDWTNLVDCGADLRDFDDAAALLSQLDLLISVDTAVVHLAGALGRPVWTLLPFQPDWRWRRDDERSCWYPTMQLFRQRAPGDWNEVIVRVAAALNAAASAPRAA